MNIEKDSDVLFFHGKTTDNCRFTIAGVIEGDDLLLGVAICAEKDQFCKAKGRAISTGRVLNQRGSVPGRSRHSMYAMNNSFQTSVGGGYPKNYFVGNEVKVYREEVLKLNKLTRDELLSEFCLKNRSK